MKQIDCDIIKDLLPNYMDKTSSISTNELIEEHLKQCNNCSNMLNEINKESDIKTSSDQERQIDYLKGYRNRILKIICIIIITILILFVGGIWLLKFLMDAQFYVNINDIYINYWTERVSDEKNEIFFNLYDWNDRFNCTEGYEYEVIEDNGRKSIHVVVIGKCPFGKVCSGWAIVEMNDTIDKVYFEDKKGNSREIWSKEKGLQSDP